MHKLVIKAVLLNENKELKAESMRQARGDMQLANVLKL